MRNLVERQNLWNLYPSRFFRRLFSGSVSCGHGGQALLPNFVNVLNGLHVLLARNHGHGIHLSNNNGRGSSFCK